MAELTTHQFELARTIVDIVNGRGEDEDFVQIVVDGCSESLGIVFEPKQIVVTLNVELYGAERVGVIATKLCQIDWADRNDLPIALLL